MSDIAKRLLASLRFDAVNGDQHERSVVASQMREAASHITTLEAELAAVTKERDGLRAGYDAALAFVDSHVADPDITQKMCETYAALQAQRAAIDKAREGK